MTLWAGGRYESVAERIARIAGQTVSAADRRRPLRDAAVVDLACGTGSAALAAADRGAAVTAVDLTPELLAAAAVKAGDREITWVPADAAATGLPDAAFDVVVSNMGIIFVEPKAQVTEIARILKPGGLLAFSSWVRGTTNPFFDPVVEVFGIPTATAFAPEQWGDQETAKTRLATDFDDIEIENGLHTWSFDSLPTALRFMSDESPVHVDVFRRADDAQRDQLVAAFESTLQPLRRADGTVSFGTSYAVITARRR